MTLQNDISLKKYNTFGIDVSAKYFASFNAVDEINELLEFKELQTTNHQLQTLILGGGSNILFTNNFDGIVLKNEIKGIEIVSEDNDHENEWFRLRFLFFFKIFNAFNFFFCNISFCIMTRGHIVQSHLI